MSQTDRAPAPIQGAFDLSQLPRVRSATLGCVPTTRWASASFALFAASPRFASVANFASLRSLCSKFHHSVVFLFTFALFVFRVPAYRMSSCELTSFSSGSPRWRPFYFTQSEIRLLLEAFSCFEVTLARARYTSTGAAGQDSCSEAELTLVRYLQERVARDALHHFGK